MQQAYVNAYTHLRQFDRRARFSTWLTKIAVYEAIARARKQGRYEPLDDEGTNLERFMATQTPNPERQAFAREIGALLESAIDDLPDGCREVFILRQVEGMNTSEVAESLGVSEDAVKTRLSRGRAALRRDLFDRAGLRAQRLPLRAPALRSRRRHGPRTHCLTRSSSARVALADLCRFQEECPPFGRIKTRRQITWRGTHARSWRTLTRSHRLHRTAWDNRDDGRSVARGPRPCTCPLEVKMSETPPTTAEPGVRRRKVSHVALKHIRSAALAAALVPLAQVAVAPVSVAAQCSGACPPAAPEPATLLLLAPAAGALAWRVRQNRKQK